MEVAEIEPNMQVDNEVEDSKQIQDEDCEEKQESQIEKKSNTISEGEGDNDENEENKESELSPEEQQLKDLRFLQGYWKLPSIAQFIKIFYPILGINQMSPQELEQCILKPEVDGTLGTLIQKLIQKPSLADNDKVSSTNNARSTSHHIPILNDMKEYRNWNEKLARKMSYMYKIYKRFVVKYDLKGNISCDENSKDSGYTSDILKHLINYDETDCSMRFLHEDMKIFDSETLAIIRLFEEMNGQNPFTSKPCIEIQQLDNPENEDNINNEGEIIEKNYDEGPCEDEEFILCMHEIPIKYRADVILFLCYLKADSEEFTKHIKRIEEDENKQRSSIKNKQSSNRKSGNEKLSGDNESKSNNKSESEEEEVGMLDTEPILLGKDSKKNTYIFFEQHKDCRVYMQNEDFSEFSLVCNSPEELKMLISKLTIEDESTIKLEKEREEKAEEGKTVNKRKTRQKQAENNISNKSSLPLNVELIKSLESLTDLFVKNNEEWNKRQMILARKLQTLERSRSLLTKQRTRRQEKELDYSLFQGRMTRGGLKTLKKNLGEDNQEDASNRSCPSNNETNKIQQIAEELRKKERQETEKIAREERLQK